MTAFLSQSSRTSRFASAWVQQPLHSTRRRTRRSITTCHASSRKELILPCHSQPIHSVMAPMVAASDYAFRCLVERHGAELTFTQMLHARNLVEDPVFRRNHLDFPFDNQKLTQSQQDCIDDMPQLDTGLYRHSPGPLIVQLAGHDPELMLRAFDVLLKEECQFSGIDVNLGCPQGEFWDGICHSPCNIIHHSYVLFCILRHCP